MLHRELGSLRDWTQSKMLEALQENTKALRRLKYEVRDLDPSDAVHNETESDLVPVVVEMPERRNRGSISGQVRKVQ
jgi:hypothetical protein